MSEKPSRFFKNIALYTIQVEKKKTNKKTKKNGSKKQALKHKDKLMALVGRCILEIAFNHSFSTI